MRIGDTITAVRSLLKSNNVDSLLTNRYIYHLLTIATDQVLTRYMNETNTLSDASLYQTIHGLETEETDALKELACFEGLDYCYALKIRRTKKEIPQIRSVNGRPLIQSVSSMDGSVKYSKAEFSSLGRIASSYLAPVLKTRYYFIHRNRIWITDDIEYISITASFKSPVDAYFCNYDDCKCVYAGDGEMAVPSGLMGDIIQTTVQMLTLGLNIQKDSEADDKKNIARPS